MANVQFAEYTNVYASILLLAKSYLTDRPLQLPKNGECDSLLTHLTMMPTRELQNFSVFDQPPMVLICIISELVIRSYR